MGLSKDNDIGVAVSLIAKDLKVVEADHFDNPNNIESLRAQLIPLISKLLNTDFTRLLNALYRIDIGEEKFKKALNLHNPDAVAPAIAELIIQRELQKVATRKKYKDTL